MQIFLRQIKQKQAYYFFQKWIMDIKAGLRGEWNKCLKSGYSLYPVLSCQAVRLKSIIKKKKGIERSLAVIYAVEILKPYE